MAKKTSSLFDAVRLCTSFFPVVGPLTDLVGGAYHEDRWMAVEGAVCLVADIFTSGAASRAAKEFWRRSCRGTKLVRSIWKIVEKKQHNQESWFPIFWSAF